MVKRISIILINLLCVSSIFGQLTIIVDEIPENTPENDPIHIAGDFQGWDPGSASFMLAEDTQLERYHITLAAGVGDIQFKFTRGDWTKVESDENGNYIPDRFYSSSNGDSIYLQILGWEDLDGNGGGTSTAAENVSIITDSFYMPEFDRYRRVWIYLPPDYEISNLDYPVLYMHDGQNVFDDLTSFVGEWHVDETLNDLHAQGDTGIIVVAIDNGGGFRTEEYTPWTNPQYGGGAGATYINFIVNTLKPYIDSNYRTLPSREHTGLMGSSLGGLISTYGGIQYQDVFSKVGAFSPSYWWSSQAYSHVTAIGKQHPMRIYQIMGTLEGSNHVDNMLAMEDTFHAAGFTDGEVLSLEHADGQHSEWYWAREFEAAYLWLFRSMTTNAKELANPIQQARVFPNPAIDQFNIEFYLKQSGEVRVTLLDSLGNEVKLLYANTLQRGDHRLGLDLKGGNLSHGIYYCKIESGDSSTTLKLVVSN